MGNPRCFSGLWVLPELRWEHSAHLSPKTSSHVPSSSPQGPVWKVKGHPSLKRMKKTEKTQVDYHHSFGLVLIRWTCQESPGDAPVYNKLNFKG